MKMLSKRTLLIVVCLLASSGVFAQELSEIVNILRGASIIAQDYQNTYLGKLTNQFSSDSIFNEYGTYGSEYSSNSIWNEYGTFGNEYSTYSPFNEYTTTPPMIIKDGQIIGYLTTNQFISGAVSPYLLKSIKDLF